MKISEIPAENRPRERFQKLGATALSPAELLAIILQKGTKEENVIDMSNRLIAAFGLNQLSELSLTELQKIKGIGPAKAMQIKAVFELNKHYCLAIMANNQKTTIKSAQDVFNYATQKIINKSQEQFSILHLNSKNTIIKFETISLGTLNSSLIHPREIFKSAIKESSNSVILFHNHPSGDPAPSKEDLEITQKLQECGELLNIKVLDHIIIGNNSYYSFKEHRQ